MGKNHRLTKKLKSEKAKIHIKSKTKFLPKGQNVTDTSFKIKPIIIQEQLKEKDTSLLLSKRKSSVNELLTKLKHYNNTIKVDACHELKEMIKTHSTEIIQTYLSSIIQTLSTLIQDRERKVRKACIGLFNEIFQNVPTFKLEAFFHYILINMKCAMTNIDKNIQEDSLLLFDVIIEHKPELLAEKFDTIFPDFLTLISKLRNQATPERTLTLNLDSKLTSIKWRIKVLSRLYGILNTMIQHSKKKETPQNDLGPIFKNAIEGSFIPIYCDIKPYETCTINYFGQNSETKQQPVDTKINVLIPLLYETWIEVVPEEKTSKKDFSEATILTEESAAIFSCVINILRLLHEYSQIHKTDDIFTSKEASKFLEHLISNFPYRQRKSNKSEFIKDFSKLFKPNFDTNCVEENLVIVYLVITFKTKANNENTRRKFSFITNYLNKCLEHNLITANSAKYLVKILDEVLLKNPKLWHRLGVNNVEIMDNVVAFYDQNKVPESIKNDFLEILTSFNGQFNYKIQQEWLGKLANCLCEEQISEKLINVILELCKQNHQQTQETVKNSLRQILDNLPKLQITETSNKDKAELSIAYIFFYVPNLSDENINAIYSFIESQGNSNYVKHFRNMLHFKLNVFK